MFSEPNQSLSKNVVFPGVGGIDVLTRRMMLYDDFQRQPTSTA